MTDQRLPHRLRLLQGLAEVLAGKEYAAVTVSDIVAAAGVSKRTFYEHFESKQECLLACYAEANGLLVAGLRSQGAGGAAHGAQRLTGLIDAYLRFLDESRATAAALLVEITSAGAEGRRVRRETNLELARVMLEVSNRPPDDPFDLDQALALVGGVTELVLTHAENHPDRPFRELRPAVLKFVGSVLRPAGVTAAAEPAGAGA
ncbi:TetR/AcrR family transcriptional regulator [Spongisporangium articulatum]|uniref:TetR/AcrR family transcriptional regulator n=1 Tax=Spongisporangium articulatum TaxID=3362603 RepID=A0ABW8AIQ4_9ACTN